MTLYDTSPAGRRRDLDRLDREARGEAPPSLHERIEVAQRHVAGLEDDRGEAMDAYRNATYDATHTRPDHDGHRRERLANSAGQAAIDSSTRKLAIADDVLDQARSTLSFLLAEYDDFVAGLPRSR